MINNISQICHANITHCSLEKTIDTAFTSQEFAGFLNCFNIDYVLIRDSALKLRECKKVKPRYKDPYMITKILNKYRYVVQDIPGFSHTARPYNSILTDRIKPICANN